MDHKSGFANIIGNPNAGKSTLMNALVGERLSIITYKAQTTRQRIFGILNGEDFQLVFSDTPGIVSPSYKLHEAMLAEISEALSDADIFLLVIDVADKEKPAPEIIDRIKKSGRPVIVVLNKMDLVKPDLLFGLADYWTKEIPGSEIIPVSALKEKNTDRLLDLVKSLLPVHPPYFDKEGLSDKTLRFFAAEIIREKIFIHCEKEVPYATQVVIDAYREEDHIDRISATIFVERESQKGILIGKAGTMLKRIGTDARIEIEKFTGKKAFLELFVKVAPNWRNDPKGLKKFGFRNPEP
jgi:GTPase